MEQIKKLEKQLALVYFQDEKGLISPGVARVQSWQLINMIGEQYKKLDL